MPIRVLHIIGRMHMGGSETFLMNVYRNIDRNKVQFDFVVHTNEKCFYDDEIEKLGGKIYRIPRFSKNPIKSMVELKKIINNNSFNYNIIHRHTNSAIVFTDLLVAKKCKIKNRYSHSHSSDLNRGKIMHKLCIPLLNKLSTKKFACSVEAAKWTFGKNNASDVEILYNGIDIKKFTFDKALRDKIREQYNCSNKTIIGHVGRFETEKNHQFIIELFSKLSKQNDLYELWLIGDGRLKEDIKEKAKKLNISEKIKFFGNRSDVNTLLQAIDVFVFPSMYEGLGISLIEAQIAGLPCVVSNAIQEEAIITENVKKLPIDNRNLEQWCLEIKKICGSNMHRHINTDNIKIKRFDIIEVTKKLENIYTNAN